MLSMLLHKCWSLKMISQNPWVYKGILKALILLHCFFFSKILTLYMCFQKNTLCSSWFWHEDKILLQVWHTTLNFFYTQSKQTPRMNSWVYFKRKPSVCTRLVLTSSIFKCLITYPLCLYRGFLENHLMLWPFFHERLYCLQSFLMRTSMFINI